MSGETDLETMLAGLTVSRRPGVHVVALVDEPVALGDGIEAIVAEPEGVTVVAHVDTATERGWSWEGEFAWLTIDIHSSLEAVGLTATFATALARHAIPCNVIAALHHDHILVPVHRADDALATLDELAREARGR